MVDKTEFPWNYALAFEITSSSSANIQIIKLYVNRINSSFLYIFFFFCNRIELLHEIICILCNKNLILYKISAIKLLYYYKIIYIKHNNLLDTIKLYSYKN